MSTLDLVSIDNSQGDLDTVDMSHDTTNTYYTLDTRRLASKHNKKNQHDR